MIEVKSLRYTWRDGEQQGRPTWRLEIPSLTIKPGERVAIIGESGVGKSTLLGLLSGWYTPQSGEVWVNGSGLHTLNASARTKWRAHNLGWQSAQVKLCEALSVYENLNLDAWLGLAHPRDQRALKSACEVARLSPELWSKSPMSLSEGERQRVEVARAVLSERPLILLDEPTAHLNGDLADQIGGWVLKLPHQPTLLIATHNRALADRCDRVIELKSSIGSEGERRIICLESSRDERQGERQGERQSDVAESHRLVSGWRAQIWRWRLSVRTLWWERWLYCAVGLAGVIALAIPRAAQQVTIGARADLSARARSTPLVIGALGSELDLFFAALYFSRTPRASLTMRQIEEMNQRAPDMVTPVLLSGQVNGAPLIATDVTYLERRAFRVMRGRIPLQIGEVILSDQLASDLGVSLDDELSTELIDLYQLTAPSPIKVRVVGTFNAPHFTDQAALFTTLTTGWAALGIAHDHQSREGEVGPQELISQRLSPERYHLHTPPERLPISAALLFPRDARTRSLLKARLSAQEDLTVIEPTPLSEETLRVVDQLRRLISPLLVILTSLTALLLLLMLTQRFLARRPLRISQSALGLSRLESFNLNIREYLMLGALVYLLLLSSLWFIDQLISPAELWRLVSDS